MFSQAQTSACTGFSQASAACSSSTTPSQKLMPKICKRSVTSHIAFQPRPMIHGVKATRSKVMAVAATEDAVLATESTLYAAPSWSKFEFGTSPVFWEPACPEPNSTMTVWFNPERTPLAGSSYIGFNGGFNGPFMCGGSPRGMALKSRADSAPALFSVRINVPEFASFLEFGFTDGENWVEGYVVKVKQPASLQGKSIDFFNAGLEREMGYDGACEAAIFPDPLPEADRCALPAGGGGLNGQKCDLDIVPGCDDPDAANYNPLANTVEGAACDFNPDI